MNIGMIIVCYNPDERTKKLIKIVNNNQNIMFVVIVDNSLQNNEKFLEIDTKKNIYIANLANLGIAEAQNIGLDILYKKGFKWVVTMDQDSIINHGLVRKYKDFINNNHDDKIAIISTNYFDVGTNEKKYNIKDKFIYVDEVISSGSLLNIDIAKKIGKMKGYYFIDQVDNEYCYRVIKSGYKIIVLDGLDMEHKIGNIKIVNLGFKKFCTYNQSPIRYYYRSRNLVYMVREYNDKSLLIKTIKNIILDTIRVFFEKNKFKKLYYMIIGIKDGIKHNINSEVKKL